MEEPQCVPELPALTFKKRATKSKSTIRKSAPSSPPNLNDASDFTSSGDEENLQVKRRRKNGVLTAKSTALETHTQPEEHALTTIALPVVSNDATKA